ncbi:MAG: phosphoadenosine phosphosulfate reductase domain-containing protein [Methanosarcinaceae archaeon]
MSKPVYLGELLLYWCPACNVPVLGKKCSCGNITQKVSITPPGDIRPAFAHDIEHINTVSQEQFGQPLVPDDRIVVLNKAPYDDRMDEIIVDGQVIASIRFEVDRLKWVLLPRLAGARRLFQGKDLSKLKNWVILDRSALQFIVKGANVLAPGIENADPDICELDEAVVLTPDKEVVATGRARMSGERMLERERGVGVKTRWKGMPEKQATPSGGQTWDEVVRANEDILDTFIEKGHQFIENVAATVKRPVSVSYSGGKDSLAMLQLVDECLDDYDILFADTGLEFPETLENVSMIGDRYNKPIRSISVGDAFWRSVDDFGPPAMEARWCCKVCKLGPITQLIEDNYENGCLTFIGQRKYESEARARSERVWKNPWVGNQIGASPIQDWTALHVWLYIFKHDLPYNPLYEQGYDRIGCWLCPSSSLADLVRLKETHPRREARLTQYLLDYAKQRGLSSQWVEYGLWRWKKLPPTMATLASDHGINVIPTHDPEQELTFTQTSGYRPCKEGGMSAEGSFNTAVDLSRLETTGMLRVVGKVLYIEGVASVSHDEDRAQVFASGTLTTRSDTEHRAKELMHRVELSVRRGLKCMGCGVCVGKCPNNAITIRNGMACIDSKCDQCGRCLNVCPVVKFGSVGHGE